MDAKGQRLAPYVSVETTVGSFQIEMYTDHAPKTCKNFQELSKRGYYNNTIFHRIIRDFMVQGGDPSGTGRGGESIYGKKFADEIKKELKHTGAGIVSMVRRGLRIPPLLLLRLLPTSIQFFITLAPTPWLDGKHTIFGRICAGMGVIKKLGSVQTGQNDRPINAVRLLRAWVGTLEEKPVKRDYNTTDIMRMVS
eukprot:g2473.t1